MMLVLKLLDPVFPRLDCRGMTFSNVTEITIRDGELKITQDLWGNVSSAVVAELITAVPGTIFYRSQGLDFQTLKIEAQ